MKRNKNRPPITLLPMALWTTVFVAVPLVYVLGLSFMKKAATWGVVAEFSLDSYKNLLNPVYLKVFAQSFWVAILTTVFALLIGYPFAYFTAKLPKKHRSLVLMLMLVPFWTNSLVRIYGWMILLRSQGVINGLLMQFGVIDKPLKLLYTFGAVLVGMVYALLPFMIFAVYSSAEKLDFSLVEAARDLGASPMKAFLTVSLKLTLPGLLSGVVLTFVPSMGLFFIADLLGGNKVVLVGNLIQAQLMNAHNWPFAAALSVVLLVLTTVILWLYRKLSGVKDLEGIV